MSTSFSSIETQLNLTPSSAIDIDNSMVRALTGNSAVQTSGTPITFNQLQNKVGFGGVIEGSNSVTNSGFGSANANSVLSIVSDIVGANIVWTTTTITGANVTMVANGTNATVSLPSNVIGNTVSNTQVSVSVSIGAHLVGSTSTYVNLLSEVFDPNLVVSGNLSANQAGFSSQVASTTLTATSNVPGGTIHFSPNPITGTSVSGNTITFTSYANSAGDDSDLSWTLTTSVVQNGSAVGGNVCSVHMHAVRYAQDFTLSVPANSNNVFANNGNTISSLTLSATNVPPIANINWSATLLSGDAASLVVAADKQSANLWVNVNDLSFGTRKSVYTITAQMVDANNTVLATHSANVILRAANYGLTYTPAANVSASGYAAQTASTTATASWQAGTFSWYYNTLSGAPLFNSNVGTTNATITANVTTSSPGSNTATFVINPTLSFDGFVMANVATSNATLTAQQNAYTFTLSGPTVNTQIGAAPANSSITTTAAHNITGGSIAWSQDNGSLAFSTNAALGTSNVSISSNSITTNFSSNLSCTLYDESSRVVEVKKVALALRTYIPNLVVSGANSVSVSSYLQNTAATNIVANFNAGANAVTQTVQAVSGTAFVAGTKSSNSTSASSPLSLSTNSSYATVTGTSNLITTLTYFDASLVSGYPVTLSATLIDPQFTVASSNGSVATFVPAEAIANTTVTASHTVPGGTCQFVLASNSGGISNYTANTTVAKFSENYSNYGATNTGLINVTVSLYNSNSELVKSISGVQAQAVVTLYNNALSLTGGTSNTASNTFSCTVSSLLTAACNTNVITPTYTFVENNIVGAPDLTTNATQLQGVCYANGITTNAATYTAKVTLYSNGNYVANTSVDVSLSATGTAPAYTFTTTNDSVGDFNYPVNSNAVCTAYSTPAGYTIWRATLTSGTAATGTVSGVGNSTFAISKTMTNIGTNTSTYTVYADFYSPDGIFLTTKSAAGVVSAAQRYNPGFSFVAGANQHNYGWSSVTANVAVSSSSNASLTGETYVLTYSVNSGAPAVANGATNGAGWVSVTQSANSKTTNSATVTFTCTLKKNGQTLAGPFSHAVSVIAEPYYVSTIASGTSPGHDTATDIRQMTSNHPAFTSANWAHTSSGGTLSIYTTTVTNDTIELEVTTAGPQETATATVNGYFTANGATRTTGSIALSVYVIGTQ